MFLRHLSLNITTKRESGSENTRPVWDSSFAQILPTKHQKIRLKIGKKNDECIYARLCKQYS